MTEQAYGFIDRSEDAAALYAANLLRYYSFELAEYSIGQLLSHWLASYPASWVQMAIVEALYQGRYKAISVEQILIFWQRRGCPLHHFSHEFERLVCHKFPRNLGALPRSTESSDTEQPERSAQTFPAKRAAAQHVAPADLSSQMPAPVPQSSAALPAIAGNASESAATPLRNGDRDSTKVNQVADQMPIEWLQQQAQAAAQSTAAAIPAPWLATTEVNRRIQKAKAVLSRLETMTARLQRLPPAAIQAAPCSPAEAGTDDRPRAPATPLHQPQWLPDRDEPIHQFIPATNPSEFHAKLKAVAQPASDDFADHATPTAPQSAMLPAATLPSKQPAEPRSIE